jgi:membrane-bound serine protease (ClpP class)
MRKWLVLGLVVSTVMGATVACGADVYVARLEGPIGPVNARHVVRAIDQASERGAEFLIIELDTPGGLDTSMREIVKALLNAPVPVVIYVFPSGAQNASAGVFITLAAHVAAMTPGTEMGAAHPVLIGPGEQAVDETMEKKMTNDAAAYIRSIAEKRGRNADWAERAVRESIAATATEALELGVIDIIAGDLDDLLAQLEGREVEIASGIKTLRTEGVEISRIEMNFGERLLTYIAHPNLVYILFILGVYGLIFEITHPGAIIPGAIGAICLILAFFAFQVFPINWAGVILIILGVILFVLEVLTPTYGPLAIGGIVAMVLGSLMLIESPEPLMRVSLPVIISAVGTTAAFFIFALSMAVRAHRRKPSTGQPGLIGEIGEVKSPIEPGNPGKVFVHGEFWNAESDETIPEGTRVEVVSVERMTLRVITIH